MDKYHISCKNGCLHKPIVMECSSVEPPPCVFICPYCGGFMTTEYQGPIPYKPDIGQEVDCG